ncbi:hypothetical protein MCU_00744 [Bartonella elizabethae Re6043vi]|uniref:Uncharacterized protein n=2 Tax=Bartonella elizabethae TaxID=807 RepID=J1A4P4_BAREL|nr:hypothetical protein [Bartonella elizabethae]EJF84076.1 hypothetical protein MCU_00744 [Bartonella elizabethae Re6043vi]EJF96683.1 hypothetical protein MEE_00582 [Bartonella elizabethae F9251 = ATCC 49927]VEJ40124.1 Uncharacterised protein [Bartonella elizabethae]
MCWPFKNTLQNNSHNTTSFSSPYSSAVWTYSLRYIHKSKLTVNMDHFWLENMKGRCDMTAEFRVP